MIENLGIQRRTSVPFPKDPGPQRVMHSRVQTLAWLPSLLTSWADISASSSWCFFSKLFTEARSLP